MGDPADGASDRNAGTIVMGGNYCIVHRSVFSRLRDVKTELTERPRDHLAHAFAATYCRAAYRNAEMIAEPISREGFHCDYHRKCWVQIRTAGEQPVLDASVHLAKTKDSTTGLGLLQTVFVTCGLSVEADAGFSLRAGT